MSLTKLPKPTKFATFAATGVLVLLLAACSGSPQPPANVSATSATLKGDARVDQGDTNASWWWQLATTEAGIGPANPTGSTSRCHGGPATLPVGDYKGLSCNVTALTPNTPYFYKLCGSTSKVGPTCSSSTIHFRTQPAEGTNGDPPTKLALLAANRADTTAAMALTSPRNFPWADEVSNKAKDIAQRFWHEAPDLPEHAAKEAALMGLHHAAKVYEWGRLPTATIGAGEVASGTSLVYHFLNGRDLLKDIWGSFLGHSIGEPMDLLVDEVRFVAPNDLLLSDGNGDARAPSFGWQYQSHLLNFGREVEAPTPDVTNCSRFIINLEGPGERVYPGDGVYGPIYECSTSRNYALFDPVDFRPCDVAGADCGGARTIDVDDTGQPPFPSEDDLQTTVMAELSSDRYPLLNHWLNHEFDPSQLDPSDTDAQVRRALNDPDTVKSDPSKSAAQILSGCGTPLFHYTTKASAQTIRQTGRVTLDPARARYPSGFVASSLTPTQPAWTQRKLSLHMFGDAAKSSAGWVMFCSSRNGRFAHPVPGTFPGQPDPASPKGYGERDWWYIAGAGGTQATVVPEASGVTQLPGS